MGIIPEQRRGRAFARLRMLRQSGGPLGSALDLPAMTALSALVVGPPGCRVRELRAQAEGEGP